METMLSLGEDLLSLFYPRLCSGCRKNLPVRQSVLCVHCRYRLPWTGFHRRPEDNPFAEQFWGRIPLQAATALCYFTRGGITQQLVHRLKYRSDTEVGLLLGKLLGSRLLEAEAFRDVSLILPVPLHPRKKRRRGYNQSDYFAQGLSGSMQRPWNGQALCRHSPTPSQTRKGRMERFANVASAFGVKSPNLLRGRHILLVDDVMTTGATLEACGRKILEIPETKLSFATIAFATL